ncbi:MAG TPA: hypothetical protein VGB15_14755 [Longimicrobium sp.]|jgi:hypothetical protein
MNRNVRDVTGRQVILASDEHEALLDDVELLRELCLAQIEVAAGETVSQEDALAHVRRTLGASTDWNAPGQ